jgi:nucleoporin NDC1
LALITDAFPDRRKTIYGELERKKAPTYQQVTEICLGEVKFLIERLNVAINPSYTPEPTNGPQQPAPPVHLVPQIARPLQNDKQITTAPAAPTSNWGHIEAATAGIAKSHSSPGNSQQAYGREALHKGLKGAKDGKQKVESLAVRYWNMLLSSYLGWPFRRSLERTARVVVLGAPYSRISTICNAITALTNLTTFSLKHDELGRFHEGVPGIVRVLTTAIKMLDEYMAKVEIHWTDYKTLSKPEAERRKVPEVEQVRECLREGLERILGSFNEYLSGLGMSKLEILEAKSAVGGTKGLEMLQR